MSSPTKQQTYRLAPQPNELIDRGRPIRFSYAGRDYDAFAGDTIASALAANGVRTVAKSFKYHRPRGLRGYGHSTDAMVQIGNRVSESLWLVPVEDGMVVEPAQTASLYAEPELSIVQQLDQSESIGYRYKEFIHPRSEWNAREQLMREGAGLGTLDITAPYEVGFDKEYLHADVVVVGAGPAGLQSGLSAANAGANVLLFDENPFLGGHLAYSSQHQDKLADLITRVQNHPNITVYMSTLVSGWFEQHWLFAVQDRRMYKIRAKATVFATGAEDQPLLFDNNDLPGVMLGSAANRLLHGYATTVGQNMLVVTANSDGWELAVDLLSVGVKVAGVVELRAQHDNAMVETVQQADVPIYWEHAVSSAQSTQSTQGMAAATVIPFTDSAQGIQIPCDSMALCTAWAPRYDLPYLADCTFTFDEASNEFRPSKVPASTFLAGRVTGAHDLQLELDDAEMAGRDAAASAGFGTSVDETADPVADQAQRDALNQRKAEQPQRTASLFRITGEPAAKRFVDFDKDVTDHDVAYSVAESYDSIELVKRYTKISTGPSQGKWSSINTIRLLAEINGKTVAETGKTTSRAPARPIKLGNLAGQMMEPVRVSPIHAWHEAQGATMMVAGEWMRPEHYGDPHAEVNAVRTGVGIIDVSTLGKIKLTGPGVPELLDKLYANRFSNLKVGRVRYGVMCNAEGVIMDDGVTARISESEWYMSTTSGGSGAVYEWIQWWVQSGWGTDLGEATVHVTSVSEGRAAFNLAGPHSRDLLEKLVDEPDALSNATFPYMRVREIAIAGVPCRLMRIGFTGELSYEIHAPSNASQYVWTRLMDAGAEFGIRPFGVEAQRILRLEKGHIIVGQDTDPLTDPFMADMAWAVKLNKADFLGKRAISRVAEQGIEQKLVGFTMMDHSVTPEEGLQIVEKVPVSDSYPIGLRIIGWICSCKFSPTLNQVIGLCWLPTELAEKAGTEFAIRREGELISAQVHHGSFYDADGGKLKA